ncbi:hypothetical protein C0991_003943 [Blastosporella zonata]|nr:hypothetical protein C0991_003943 [Blastosporella zonata]
MSHLDAEFKKQANPIVKSLVTDQFQGKQVYGTLCNQCQYRSERVSDFLEIEINLKNNAKLEDRIHAVLQPETLSGDNQYLCSRCEGLRDATRYTKLKELPPVLHFSLLRFVYDLATMERKKSKHSVSFPKTLDMTPFMGPRGDGLSETDVHGTNVYELRGVLLHKGSSAHHGHYEAQVFDHTNKCWYQFNDETVKKIKSLGEKPRSQPIVVDDGSDEKSQSRKHSSNIRKRRRVESEDENGSPPIVEEDKPMEYISSKDAYMLIYARKANLSSSVASFSLANVDTKLDIPTPPSEAMDVVNALNVAHDEACETYDKKEKLVKARFHERRRKVVDTYRRWNVDSIDADTVLVSRQALSAWLSQHHDKLSSTIATDESDGMNAKLKNLHEHLLSEEALAAHDMPCALIPVAFAKTWKKWLSRPTDCPRPERVDNTPFMCEHDMLAIDPNIPSDLESTAVLVLKSDWDILESMYLVGPLISITKSNQDGDPSSPYIHTPLVCTDCRMQRKTEWTSTEITIRLGGTKSKVKEQKGFKKGATYSTSGPRQSRRLRQSKELGEKRRFTISKLTTVKEIKVMQVQEELEIPTICQRLFLGDKELDDNMATVESLGIFAHDVLDLSRENEVVDLDSDSEEKKRPRDEERGFHGTLLGKSTSPSPDDDAAAGKSCRACTFSNEANALSCIVCDTLFI